MYLRQSSKRPFKQFVSVYLHEIGMLVCRDFTGSRFKDLYVFDSLAVPPCVWRPVVVRSVASVTINASLTQDSRTLSQPGCGQMVILITGNQSNK